MCENDYDNWTPTVANINALPILIKSYIHDLIASCPSELVAENYALKNNLEGLKAMIKENK